MCYDVLADINECLLAPCINGGTCENLNGTYQCLCTAGWTGLNCDSGDWLTQSVDKWASERDISPNLVKLWIIKLKNH